MRVRINEAQIIEGLLYFLGCDGSDCIECSCTCILNIHVLEVFTLGCLLTCPSSYSHTATTDLKDVYEYVFELDKSHFEQLGLQLGLLQPTLKHINDTTKPEDYGLEVMVEWLKQVDNAKPTWNNLAKALDKKTVKGHVQANQIRENLKST